MTDPATSSRSQGAPQRGWRRALAAIGAALGTVLASPALGQLNPKEPPESIRGLDDEVKDRLGQKVDLDLAFTNSDGKPVTLRQFFNDGDKPVVMAMVYFRCPMQCPTILNNLLARFNEIDLTIGEKYNVVVVSFDPTEGVDAAASQKLGTIYGYGRAHPESLDRSWAFLTGTAQNARALADSLGFAYRYLPESNEYSHATMLFVLTPGGTISRVLYGVNYSATELRLSLLDASDGKIGGLVDRMLLWCFHYDPRTGSYTLSAMRVMQVGAGFAGLFVGAILTRMWFVERRRRRLAGAAGTLVSPEHMDVDGAGGPGTDRWAAANTSGLTR